MIDLEKQCKKILADYGKDVTKDMTEAVKKAARVGARKVKENASVFGGTGQYAKGWTSQVETGRVSAQGTIYNRSLPGLPHLLEHGHAKRNGGRVPGRVHIKPVEEELEKLFVNELEQTL